MTDKVQKIRKEIARIQLYTQSEVLKQVLDYIDEVQKEEIPPKFPLISQKKCMYTKDSYTDEDRKVLCDGCEEKCEYSKKEEPAPKIFEDMLNAKTPAESLGISAEEHDKIIDLCLYGKESEIVDIDDLPKEEPVSDDLEEAADNALSNVLNAHEIVNVRSCLEMFKSGAKWQKEQIIKRLCNHANIDQMVEKFEYKYKPEKVLDTEYYKRGIFDTIKTIKEG